MSRSHETEYGWPCIGAARFFSESGGVERHDAIPGLVLDTLFGRGAVHTLDGRAHELRKALFLALLTGDGVATLTRLEYYLPPQDLTIDLARGTGPGRRRAAHRGGLTAGVTASRSPVIDRS